MSNTSNITDVKIQKKKRKTQANKINFSSEHKITESATKKLKTNAMQKYTNPKNSSKTSKIHSIDKLAEKFEDLFLNEDKITEKRVREFTKEAFAIVNSTNATNLNYNNLIFFLLKFSGLEVENNPNYKRLIESINDDNFADFELLEEIISNSKVKNEKFKVVKVYTIFENIVAEIYNNYEITTHDDFEILRKFILNILKLTQNKYRKLRYYSSLILVNIFKLILEEKISTQKLLNQRNRVYLKTSTKNKNKILDNFVQTTNKKSLEDNTNNLLENKISLLSELISILKENFIFKKISDVSKNIRLLICDYIIKISKNNFNELFECEKFINFFPFFLSDNSTNIKYKYLQLIYEKLDLTDENKMDVDEDEEDVGNSKGNLKYFYKIYLVKPQPYTIKTIIKILQVARDAILNICVKEDKLIARQAIKIIELLSQHNILEIKTVQSLLPHLFNPEIQIRNLISKVVVNYILNFEKKSANSNDDENIKMKEENEDEITTNINNITKHKSSKSKLNKKANNNSTIENLMQLLEFFLKLGENEEKLVKVLVDNFYSHLNIFTQFNLFFELIGILLNNFANSENEDTNANSQNLLQTCLIVLNFSVEKLQMEIEEDEIKNSANNLNNNETNILTNISNNQNLPKNEEFINLFIHNITSFLKKIRINLNTPTQCENFILLLKSFNNFKIYNKNIIKFNLDKLTEILIELKNSFFINMREITFSFEEESIENFFENLVDSILKAIYKILNNSTNKDFNSHNSIINVIYSPTQDSLAKEFCEILYKEILSTTFFKTLSLIKSDVFNLNYLSDPNNNINADILNRIYIILTQFNFLLKYFKDIFINNKEDNENVLNLYTFANFIENLIRFLHKFVNYENFIFFKLVGMCVQLLESIHLINFNQIISSAVNNYNKNNSDLIEKYISHRNNILITISYIIKEIEFANNNSEFNTELLKIKTKSICSLLEMLIYITSEKIENNYLKFIIEDEMTLMIENFIKNNFVNFYIEYNRKENLIINSDDYNNNENVNSQKSEELSLKTILFKNLCEKFSRLILLNLGVFKYTNFCSIYFESFYMLKLPAVIENLNLHVYEKLIEKEINHFMKGANINKIKNSELSFNNNVTNPGNVTTGNSNFTTPMNIMIFYLTKITMRVFSNKSKLFSEENSINASSILDQEEKVEIISRFINFYMKTQKKMKFKYNKENFDMMANDKIFFENFIINSINFALESRSEVFENKNENRNKVNNKINEDDITINNSNKIKSTIFIENIRFFEIIKYFLKNSVFLGENDYKNILMIFLKLSKPVELTENVIRGHISILEKFKNFLLSKAKVFISNSNNDLNNEKGNLGNEDNDENNIIMTTAKKNNIKKNINSRSNAKKGKKIDFSQFNDDEESEEDEVADRDKNQDEENSQKDESIQQLVKNKKNIKINTYNDNVDNVTKDDNKKKTKNEKVTITSKINKENNKSGIKRKHKEMEQIDKTQEENKSTQIKVKSINNKRLKKK